MTIDSFVEIRSWEYKFHELPKSVASCFSPGERIVYETGTGAIRDCLIATGEPAMLEACSIFDNAYPFRVYIEDYLVSPRLWFSLSNIRLKHGIQLMLPKSSDFHNLPERVTRLCQGLGGLTSRTPYFPRFTAPSLVSLAGQDRNYWSIISYGNSDLLVISEDARVSYWDHTSNEIKEVPLELFLDPFLSDLFSFEDFNP